MNSDKYCQQLDNLTIDNNPKEASNFGQL